MAAFDKSSDEIKRHQPDEFSEEFQNLTNEILKDIKGIRSLALAPDAVVTFINPPKGNEVAIGDDLRADPARRDAVERAIRERKFIVAGPVELRQGGVALIGRLPVFQPSEGERKERFWGFSVIVLDLAPLLKEGGLLGQDTGLRYAIRGKDGLGAEGAVFYGEEALFDANPVIIDVSLPNGSWQIAAEPAQGWGGETTDRINFWVLGTVLAGSIGFLIFVLLNRPLQLRAAHNAPSESEGLLNSIIENAPVGLLIKDSHHVVERANDTYLNWYGFDLDTMAGHRSGEIVDFQNSKEAEFINAQERDVLTTGLIQTRQLERLFADGKTHTSNITKFPVYDQDGNITKVGSVSIDLTEQVQAQKIADTALQEAETANRAKSEFLAAMSHDLRTPLNAILGFADILSHQFFGPIGDKNKEYADDIKSSGEHLLTLVNDILDLSAIEAGKQSLIKEKLPTEELVAECMKIDSEIAESKGIELEAKAPGGPSSLYADKRAVKQILLNLLSNAVKFTPEGGKVTVAAQASNLSMTLTVVDTGQGIPAEKIPILTDPFTRADSDPYLAEQGWGLGLTITKSLVDLHEGRLDIKSKVGKGATVTVTFPNGAP